jgi:hypothetical protein
MQPVQWKRVHLPERTGFCQGPAFYDKWNMFFLFMENTSKMMEWRSEKTIYLICKWTNYSLVANT